MVNRSAPGNHAWSAPVTPSTSSNHLRLRPITPSARGDYGKLPSARRNRLTRSDPFASARARPHAALLDPGDESDDVSGWGGLTGFSSRFADAVRHAVNEQESP